MTVIEMQNLFQILHPANPILKISVKEINRVKITAQSYGGNEVTGQAETAGGTRERDQRPSRREWKVRT